MSTVKIAISIEQNILKEIDNLVKEKIFPNRSRAIQYAVEDKINRISQNRLSKECLKLDVKFEKALADEGISGEIEEWPEY